MDALQDRAILRRICSILTCIVLISQFRNIEASAEGNPGTSGETANSASTRPQPGSVFDLNDGESQSAKQFLPLVPESCSASHSHGVDRPLLLLSTIDGRIVALDIQNAGQQQWTMDAGIGPLLSSSISQFEISGPEGMYKVIPSLNGGLFKWDGQVLEAVPFTAETLLSTSFKLSDEMVMVGGKEINSFGINARTGELQYVCRSGGCEVYGDEASNEEDIIVIQHTRQTVRAVDQRNGSEKWNFSVGQHDVTFLRGMQPSEDDDGQDFEDNQEEDVVCEAEDEEDYDEGYAPSVMVDMSAKTVFAVGSERQLLWTHQLESSIANAWTIRNGVVSRVDLFAPVTLDMTSDDTPLMTPFFSDHANPMLYVGSHKDQLYVHPSESTQAEVAVAAWAAQRGQAGAHDGSLMAPRVQWRPYAYTSVSRTPSLVTRQNEENLEASERERGRQQTSQVSVWNQYPFDNGYYLLQDLSPREWKTPGRRGVTETNESEDAGLEILFSTSVWTWWREIMSTSILIAIGMQMFYYCVLKPKRQRRLMEREKKQNVGDERATEETNNVDADNTPQKTPSSAEYKSRFHSDFDHMECLGKGGFGIVFQAKNKIDENSYAVKRITLPNREEAREKVLREARTLAILDHSGIVRYFNSWLEEPPVGWQDTRDKHLVGESNDLLSSVGTPAFFNKNSELVRNREQLLQQTGGKTSTSTDFGLEMNNRPQRGSPVLRFDLTDCDEETEESGKGGSGKRGVNQKGDGRSLGVESDILFPGAVNSLSGGFELGSDLDESSSFSIDFQGADESANDSICSVSKVSDSGERTPMNGSFVKQSASSRSTDTSTGNTPVELPFQHYQGNVDSKEIRELDHSDSFQIIFDDSGCSNRRGYSDNTSEASTHSDASEAASDSGTQNNNDGDDTGDGANSRKSSSKLCNESSKNSRSTRDDDLLQLSTSRRSRGPPVAKVARIYLYIQMQLCQKETLKDWLSTNTLSRDRNKVLHIFHQILEACSYIHGCGMIHRDLKPSNIFFSLDGKVKVGDFGLVTAMDTGIEDAEDEDDASGGLQLHTGKVGTQLYMSPEQLTGQNYDHKVDIFSLGLIFFELFHPFSTQMERITVMCQVKRQDVPKRFTTELPLEAKFARWLMSHNPDMRPDSEEVNESTLCADLYEDYVPPSTHNMRRRGTSSSSLNNTAS